MHRILIVDDEQSIRDALARWFSLRGFDVTTARDGQEALSLCSDYAFDIITMDLEMPRMSGNEAIARIRETLPDVPIIILTGFPSDADAVLDGGASLVLTKPLRLKELESEVLKLIVPAAE